MTPAARHSLAAVDVLILAGGLGTRIRPVLGGTPKFLAPVGQRPFAEFMFGYLASFGARRIVLGLGVGSDAVIEYLHRRPADGLEIVPMVEPEPLGTAGAVRWAASALSSDPVLALNGDTFCEIDLTAALARHRAATPPVTMVCARVGDVSRYGSVVIDDHGWVARYREKDVENTGPGLISAGIYFFSAAAMRLLAGSTARSLESEFFPALEARAIATFITEGAFIDIGTPESYARIKDGNLAWPGTNDRQPHTI